VTAAVGTNSQGGTVSFRLVGNATGLGSGTLDSSGMLSIGLPSLPVGSWPIMASYQGSGTAQASTSLPFTLNAPLLFVSPGQVNFLVPADVTTGQTIASVTVNERLLSGQAAINAVAPAIFTADGTQASHPVFLCDASGCQPTTIDVSNSTDTNVLVLYATGVRNAVFASISAQIGSISPTVLFAGAQSQFPGLDQINLQLPSSLAGSGPVTLQIRAAGQRANPVKLLFR
jgi:uncharacterized protein (TIGR03437 family)